VLPVLSRPFPSPAPLGLAERATLGSLQTEEWGQFLHICDVINATEEGALRGGAAASGASDPKRNGERREQLWFPGESLACRGAIGAFRACTRRFCSVDMR
uniref:Target of myb1 like 1 membrane trafficking protein n=1 Tax=Malurus cyaneus samueli TaxID=2593467 RepID=A0A8C5TNM5_9PASS